MHFFSTSYHFYLQEVDQQLSFNDVSIRSQDLPSTVFQDGVLSTTFWTDPDLSRSSCDYIQVNSGLCASQDDRDCVSIQTMSTPLSRTVSDSVSSLLDLSPVPSSPFRTSIDHLPFDCHICWDCDASFEDQSLITEPIDQLDWYTSSEQDSSHGFETETLNRLQVLETKSQEKVNRIEAKCTKTAALMSDTVVKRVAGKKCLSRKLRTMKRYLKCAKRIVNLWYI